MTRVNRCAQFAFFMATAFALALASMAVAAPVYAQGEGWTGTMTVVEHTVLSNSAGTQTVDSTITYNIQGPDQDPQVNVWTQAITWSGHWTVALNYAPDPTTGNGCVGSGNLDQSGSGTFSMTFIPVGSDYVSYVAGASAGYPMFQVDIPGCPGWTPHVTANDANAPFEPAPGSTLSGTYQSSQIGIGQSTTLTSSWDLSIDPAALPPNTPLGDPVVTPVDQQTGAGPATLSFSGVTQAGQTMLTISTPNPVPPAPSGFSLGSPPTFYDITTSAIFSQVVVCIMDSTITSASRLLHYVAGIATDVTDTAHGYPDLVTSTICSYPLTSLSPFTIATQTGTDTSPPVTTAAVNPVANLAGWNRTPVTVGLQAVDPDGAADVGRIHYSASGAQIIAPASVAGSVASVVISAEGVTTLSFFAEDLAGNAEAAKSVTVRIDETLPVVSYSGNAATYTVDQLVSITCTATDPVNANGSAASGLASDNCRNVAGPAYAFGVGSHTYSATATDNAGNSGSASITFSIQVAAGSLCSLTKQFVETSAKFNALPTAEQTQWDGFANQMCLRLAAASARATPQQKTQAIAAYQALLPVLVRAGLLSSDQAATLLALSRVLTA